jgi:hypothetical protein
MRYDRYCDVWANQFPIIRWNGGLHGLSIAPVVVVRRSPENGIKLMETPEGD